MLAASHRITSALPSIPFGAMDDPGTINPAALNTPCKHQHFLHQRAVRRDQPDERAVARKLRPS